MDRVPWLVSLASLLLLLVVSAGANQRVLEICGAGSVTLDTCGNCCALEKGCVYVNPWLGSVTCIGGRSRPCPRNCRGIEIRVCPADKATGIRTTTIRVVQFGHASHQENCVLYSMFTGVKLENANNQLESPTELLPLESSSPTEELAVEEDSRELMSSSTSSRPCLRNAVEVCHGTVRRTCLHCGALELGCMDLGGSTGVCIPTGVGWRSRLCYNVVSACSDSVGFMGTTVDYTSCHMCRNPSKPDCALYDRSTGEPLCLKNVLSLKREQE